MVGYWLVMNTVFDSGCSGAGAERGSRRKQKSDK